MVGSASRTAFVGREPERAILLERLAAAGTGAGETVLVAGEAGIGKSRLMAEARTCATARGFRVLEGHCFETDRVLPYAPFLDLVRSLLYGRESEETDRLLGDAAPELIKILPELAPRLPGVTRTPSLDPEQEKRRLVHALTQFLIQLTASGPVLVVLEDLHWADETSLEVVLALARHPVAQPMLIALTYRTDEVQPALGRVLAELQRERLATELTISRLGPADANTMIRAIVAQDRVLRRDVLDAIRGLTDGNPFFIEEVLKALLVSGDLEAFAGRPDRLPLEKLRIPRTIQDAVRRRVERLSEAARATLRLAAVAGQRFDFTLLQTLSGLDEPGLLHQVRELIEAQLVVEESAERFAFRHALTRQAVYAGLLARERRALHARIADAMAPLDHGGLSARLADLAYHSFAAEQWDRARAYSMRAGEQALALYAPSAAIDHLSHALTAAGELGGPLPAGLHRSRGQAFEILGDFDSAAADYTAAADLASLSGDRSAEWQALLDLGQLWSSRDYARTGEYIRRALEIARGLGDPVTLAGTLNRLGNWHINREELHDALRYHREALALFERLDDSRGIAETLDVLAMTEVIGANLAAAEAAWARAIPLLRSLDDRPRLVIDLTMWPLMSGFYWSDTLVPVAMEPAQAIQASHEALAIARAIEFRAGEAVALYELALWHGPRGEYAPALELASASLAVAEEIEHREWVVGARCALGALHLDLLNLAAAQEQLEPAYALAEEIGSSIWIRLAASVLAATYLEQGEPARAASLLDRSNNGETPLDTLGQRRCWCVRAELALATGEAEWALAIAERLIVPPPGASAGVVAPRLGKLRGEALLALGRTSEAEAALQDARQMAVVFSQRPYLWRSEMSLGRLYQHQGRRNAAYAAFTAARSTFEGLAREVTDRSLRASFLHRATARIPEPYRSAVFDRAVPAYPGGLTPREVEVLRLIADGRSNAEIAAVLVLSERTAERHIANIYQKIGARGKAARAAATAYALRQGIVSPTM